MPDIVFIHWFKSDYLEPVQASRAAFQVLRGSAQREVHAFEAVPRQSMIFIVPDFPVDISSPMDIINRSLLIFNRPLEGGQGFVREKQMAAKVRGYMAGFEYAEGY